MQRFVPGLICLIAGSVLLFLSAPLTVQAQPGDAEFAPNAPEHLLDGTSFNYFYQNGSGLRIAFYDGMVQYEWIAGPRTGNRAADLAYRSRQMAEDLYLVSWHEPSKPDYVTLVVNLNNNVIYSSSILRYGTDDELVVYQGGIIEHVQRTN